GRFSPPAQPAVVTQLDTVGGCIVLVFSQVAPLGAGHDDVVAHDLAGVLVAPVPTQVEIVGHAVGPHEAVFVGEPGHRRPAGDTGAAQVLEIGLDIESGPVAEVEAVFRRLIGLGQRAQSGDAQDQAQRFATQSNLH